MGHVEPVRFGELRRVAVRQVVRGDQLVALADPLPADLQVRQCDAPPSAVDDAAVAQQLLDRIRHECVVTAADCGELVWVLAAGRTGKGPAPSGTRACRTGPPISQSCLLQGVTKRVFTNLLNKC
ncbi:hypothetical protein GCM10010376_61750 [Streptomyces violaceusniger]